MTCVTVIPAAIGNSAIASVVPAQTQWIVLPSPVQSGTVVVKNGGAILESRVVPIEAAALDDDFSLPERPDVVAWGKGQQVFRLYAGGISKIYCSIHPRRGQVADALLLRTPDTYICFIDANADGRFESFYQLRAKNSTTLPIFRSAKTDGTPLTRPIAYHLIDPRTDPDQYLLRVVYTGAPLFGKKQYFGLTFGTANKPLPLTTQAKLDLTGPNRVAWLAKASFMLNSVDDQGAHVTIRNGIPMQRFLLNISAPRMTFVYYHYR
jgi:hypothetical protein